MVRVAIGQKAIVTLDKGGGFEAIVDKIFQLWMPVLAPLKLKHIFTSACKLYPNLTEANIIIQTKENTITIQEVI
jgi:hypothetical protein